MDFYHIAGRSCSSRGNRGVALRKEIEKTRFAGIRRTQYRDHQSIANTLSLSPVRQ